MTNLIEYIAESFICGALFLIVFKLIVEKGGSYQFQRGYLLFASFFTAVFPLIDIPSPKLSIINITLPELYVRASVPSGTSDILGFWPFKIEQTGMVVFWFFAALLALFFLNQLFILFYLYFKSEKIKRDGITIVLNSKISSPFSFFRSVYIRKGIGEKPLKSILSHEFSHIERGHSYDILFLSLIKIVQWFNPFIYIIHKMLVSVHEYQADRDVLEKGFNLEDYQRVILSLQFGFSPVLSNGLHNSLTIKRFRKMGNLLKKKTSVWSVLVVVLFVSALFAVVSCKSRKEPEVVKEQAKVAGELKDATAGTNLPDETSAGKEAVPFTVVTVKPTFNGGDENDFTKWVAKELKYPAIAKEKKIEGRVILQFIVNKEGKVTNVKVVKSANPLLDKEAVRAVSSSPLWAPGYQNKSLVDVIYTFPVIFMLK